MKRLLFCALSLSLVGAPVAADDEADEADVYEMGEVIITGSKLPQTPGNVTQKISIITADDMSSLVLGNGNLAEMLSYSPGNFANVLSRNDANWGSSGGLAHTYKGYMLDGLPIDAFVDLQSLDPWAFQRVEDQRGSASVLYPTYLAMDFAGNQSPLAGTANFILKERVSSTRTSASAYYGSYNTLGGRFFHQRATGNFHMFVGSHYEDSDYTDYGTEGSWLNMIDNPGYEKTKLYGRGAYFIDGQADHRISFYAHRTWHTGDAGRPYRGFDHLYTTLNAHYVRPVQENMTGQLRLGYRDYVRTWEDDNYPASIEWTKDNGMLQNILPLDLSLSYEHGGNDRLTGGVDYQLAQYETYAHTDQLLLGNDAQAIHLGLYLQEEQVWNDLVFRLGGRVNRIQHDIDLFQGAAPGDDSAAWTKLLGSAGVRYNQRSLSLFANAGTSFKAPGLKSVGGTIPLSERGKFYTKAEADSLGRLPELEQVVVTQDTLYSMSGHVPNPDLNPESGLSLDVGGNLVVEGLTLGVRGFLIRINDQITQIEVPDAPQSEDINAGKTQSVGVELELKHSPFDGLQWYANHTFTQAKVVDHPDTNVSDATLSFVPKNVTNVGGSLSLLPWDLQISANLQVFGSINTNIHKDPASQGSIDGYQLVTARIGKRFADRDGREIQAYLEPYNITDLITDNAFEMPWGFQDPGFSANGGLMVSF